MVYLKGKRENEAKAWMNEAARVAKKALCHRAKCGTVIVQNGEIVGEGYNAPPLDDAKNGMCHETDEPHKKPKYDRTCCMHAEWRAIMDALKRNPGKLSGATLYFTRVDEGGNIKRSGKPYCTVCSRMALDVGIATFILWHDDGICEYPTDEYNRLSYHYKNE
jgi:deoxycytidylate deaminase